jgi:hypothetical protein
MERHLVAQDDKTLIDYAVITTDELKALADECSVQRDAGMSGDGDMKVLAHVNGWVIEDWCNRNGVVWAEFMRDPSIQTKFINDPCNKPFRVWQGRV